MSNLFSVIVIDGQAEIPEDFVSRFTPEIPFDAPELVPGLTAAFQVIFETPFKVCFVSDSVVGDRQSFFADMKKMGRHQEMYFVLVSKSVKAETNRFAPTDVQFNCVISCEANAKDCEALKKLLEKEFKKLEAEAHLRDIESAMDLLLKEVDEAADNIRRGQSRKIAKVASGLINIHSQFDEGLLNQYFSSLSDSSTKAKPVQRLLKAIPPALLTRNLPGLTETGYVGVSARVSKMLLRKFGEEIISAFSEDRPVEGEGSSKAVEVHAELTADQVPVDTVTPDQ